MNLLDRELSALIEGDFKTRRIDPYVGERPIQPMVHEAPQVPLAEDHWQQAAAQQKAQRAKVSKKIGKEIKSVHSDKLKVGDSLYYGAHLVTIQKISKGRNGKRFTLSGIGGGPIETELGLDPSYLGVTEDAVAPKTGVGKLLSSMLAESPDQDDLSDFIEHIVIGEEWPDWEGIGLLEYKIPSPDQMEARRRAKFFLPKDVEPTYYKTPAGLLILSWESHGKSSGIAFTGKSEKPLWYHYFNSPEALAKKIANTIKSHQSSMERKAKNKKEVADFEHSYKVGDILYSSWGYDQTNVDWYQVIEITKKSVSLRKIYSTIKSAGVGSDNSMPVKGKFKDKALNMKRVRPSNDGRGSISLTSYSSAYPWDGRPKHQTASGYGH